MRDLIKSAGDFWGRYECKEIFYIKFVAVDVAYGRQNILREMLIRSLSIASALGLKVCLGTLKCFCLLNFKMRMFGMVERVIVLEINL